jgi:ankyrin repeat protein
MKKERIEHFSLSLWVSGFCILFILVFFTNGYSQDIHSAVSEGDLEKVGSLLKENPLLVNKEDSNGRTPIFTAVARRNLEMVKFLIDNGALVRVGDSNLRAPIHFAGFNNDTNMMELLLEKGAVIDTRAIGAATPLIHSSLLNSHEMSRFLIEHGADINIQCNSLTTPLYFASLNNNLGYLDYLLDAGADVDTPDFLNRTPLYAAVRDGYKEIVKTLMDNGADFRIRDTHLNRSLLHLASIQGHREIAEILIHEGMDINEKDERGYMPLDYAKRYGHESMAEFLEKNGGKSSLTSMSASTENVENEEILQGDAIVIKLQNGSWGIRTNGHFLILGYSEIGNPPPEPSILNGYITGNEMKDMPWIYFDLGFHPPKALYALQGRTPIYSMQDRVKHLSFVLNDVFDRYYSGLDLVHPYFPKPGQSIDVEGMKVTVVQSYRNKKGYFIQCDDLSIFWLSGLSDDYITSKKDTEAIEFVKENFSDIDLLFLGTPEGIGPEKGNGIRESFVESMRLDPKAVFFMGKEPLERRILYQIKRRIQGPGNIYCAENPGDLFFFSKGEIK